MSKPPVWIAFQIRVLVAVILVIFAFLTNPLTMNYLYRWSFLREQFWGLDGHEHCLYRSRRSIEVGKRMGKWGGWGKVYPHQNVTSITKSRGMGIPQGKTFPHREPSLYIRKYVG
jgi:hypothetical protein